MHNCSGCSDMEKLFLNYSSGKVTERWRAGIEKRWFALAVLWKKRRRRNVSFNISFFSSSLSKHFLTLIQPLMHKAPSFVEGQTLCFWRQVLTLNTWWTATWLLLVVRFNQGGILGQKKGVNCLQIVEIRRLCWNVVYLFILSSIWKIF